jgi:5-methylthioribose kinase
VEARVIRHTLACLLARVTGKSPLEYLTLAEQTRQRDVVLALIGEPPTSVPALIVDFVTRIETYA